MKVSGNQVLNLKNHLRVRDDIRAGTGTIKKVHSRWEEIYNKFIVARFDKFAAGGGNWRRLTPAYKRSKKKNQDKILIHTKFMRLKLAHGVRILQSNRNSIQMGFDMGMMHPDSDLTVDELAKIHDQGLGYAPRRRILVLPDDKTAREMKIAQQDTFAREMNGGS